MTRTAEESGAESGAAGQAKGSGAASPDASSDTVSGGHLVAKALDLGYRTVGRNRDIDLGLVGDPGAGLAATVQAASGRAGGSGSVKRKAWFEELRRQEEDAYRKRLPRQLSDAEPIHPLRVAREINEFLTEDSIDIGDGGDIVTFSGGVVQPKSPGHWMDPGPLATLGVGIPFVMAAKYARPDKEVVALSGDRTINVWVDPDAYVPGTVNQTMYK